MSQILVTNPGPAEMIGHRESWVCSTMRPCTDCDPATRMSVTVSGLANRAYGTAPMHGTSKAKISSTSYKYTTNGCDHRLEKHHDFKVVRHSGTNGVRNTNSHICDFGKGEATNAPLRKQRLFIVYVRYTYTYTYTVYAYIKVYKHFDSYCIFIWYTISEICELWLIAVCPSWGACAHIHALYNDVMRNTTIHSTGISFSFSYPKWHLPFLWRGGESMSEVFSMAGFDKCRATTIDEFLMPLWVPIRTLPLNLAISCESIGERNLTFVGDSMSLRWKTHTDF